MRATKVSQQNRLSAAWSSENTIRPQAQEFEMIRAGLLSVGLRRMQDATGLSIDYCSKIKRGIKVPHPRHWEALRQLSQAVHD
jgi:hypothetical protein